MTLISKETGLAVAGTALLAGAACFAFGRHRSNRQLKQLQELLAHEQEKRAADRTGRIKAEQQLKRLRLAQASSPEQSAGGGAGLVFPLTAIGTLRSCFSSRTGTPRQPHLVPAARAVLQLAPGVPPASLQGVEQFSHVWLLYVFHENTDLAKLMAARAAASSNGAGSGGPAAHTAGVKSMIRVPRLNGAKMGVLATRSPHRPAPIGLSTAQVLSVDPVAGVLVLGGADVVDGSPVLDIKPYVPFSDALPATAPAWVQAEAAAEPLALAGVTLGPAAAAELAAAWQAGRQRSLYDTPEAFIELVQQVLARDIRSLHQRTNVLPVQQQQQQQQQGDNGQPGVMNEAAAAGHRAGPKQLHEQRRQERQLGAHSTYSSSDGPVGPYVVVLEGVSIAYDICSETGRVIVCGASRRMPSEP